MRPGWRTSWMSPRIFCVPNRVSEKQEQFERVFAAIGGLQTVHSKAQLDLNNIESIFTALELGRIIRQRVPGLTVKEISDAISSLKELIVKTLEVTIAFPSHQGSIGVPKPYESFAELIIHLRREAFPTQSVAIITFNYDIAADMALYQAGLGPNYIIEQAPQSRDSVALLKLHGSLNWATERDTKHIRPLHLHDYLQNYKVLGFEEHRTVSVPIGSHLVEYFSKYASTVVDPQPVIVPPSWNKADYHQALSDVWAVAAANLSEAEYIFIIGSRCQRRTRSSGISMPLEV